MKSIQTGLCILLAVLFFDCKKESKIEPVNIERFDTELYQLLMHPGDTSAEHRFLSRYSDFLPVYLSGVLHAPQAGRMQSIAALRAYFQDSSLMKLYADEQVEFRNLSGFEQELGKAVWRYKEIFPKDPDVKFSMHLSGLSQSVVTVGNRVSIAGDKYMGKNYPLYHGYYYDYQIPEMEKSRLVRDALKAFLFGRFPLENQQNLLDQMVYQGKIHYLLMQLLPDVSPEQLFSYNKKQWEWLQKGESGIWLYMADNQHLYSTDPIVEAKYIGEAPFTTYFGDGSPPKVGVWIGYRIVQAYMDKTNASLQELFRLTDGKAVLQESGYRP